MGLQKKVFHPKLDRKPSKEEIDRRELAWRILCETGSVCLNDPTKKVESIKEILEQNPNAFMGAHCDYNGEIPYDEFVKRALAGEYDRE